MGKFKQTLKDIKSVKIQGAENVAKASMEALMSHFTKKNFKKSSAFISRLQSASKRLAATRPTEPLMRNSIKFVFKEIGSEGEPKEMLSRLFSACRQVLYHYQVTEQSIADMAANKIEDGMKIFTHCHSSSVVASLKRAKEQGKSFEVYNTETRPLFQGRKTAKELAKMKIPVRHFVDSGARIALKECDLMLIGADAITSEGKVINKIGSEMFAIIAEKYGVQTYVCADSWKFDPKSIYGIPEPIEKRSYKEVWGRPPRGVKVNNIAFEKVHPDLIAAIISELGVYPPENFVSEVRTAYPWLSR